MLRRNRSTFYCFSPPIMIATCLIELGLLAYSLWKYRWTPIVRLIGLLFLLLAVFQAAEFMVCTGSAGGVQWSRLGFVAITLLPPLGIHALATVHKQPRHLVVYLAYATSAVFVAYFALAANSFNGHHCLGNYVIFQVNSNLTWLYIMYYYGWVLTGMYLGWKWGRATKQRPIRQALYGFTWGYAAFMVPTATVNVLDSTTTNGIPSIMCGFAVLFAIVAGAWVLPRVGKLRRR